jgi:hypothetical protein
LIFARDYGWLGRCASLILLLTSVVTSQANEALRDELHQRTADTHTRVMDYKDARNAVIGFLHSEVGDGGRYFIRDVYCQKEYTTRGPNNGASGLNVEHTWPQSLFFGGSERIAMKSDLHHLFPAGTHINGERGNTKFGEVTDHLEPLSCTASRLGLGAEADLRFEPPDAHKGNVARALFYFAVRYGGQIDADEEAVLRKWNKLDPVDQAERHRNDEIEKLQGNRNPFIDHPEFVDDIADF